MKLEEEAISEILVGDTALQSGAKGSNVMRLVWGRRGTTTTAAASLSRSSHNKQWPVKSTHCSAVCVLAAKERAQCARCDVGLCVVPCFMEYHTKVNL